MTGIVEYLVVIGITWGVRTIADLGVKHSKKTENTVDDIIFTNLKKITTIFNLKRK